MKINKYLYIVITIILLLAVGVKFIFLKKENSNNNISSHNIPIQLEKIYKNNKIEITNNPDQFTINSSEFYAKNITAGDINLLLVVENYNDQGGIYRFYSSDNEPKLLKEVGALIPPTDSAQLFNENLFKKDITGDKIDELFVMVQRAGQVTSYEILRWDGNSLKNIKLNSEKSDWVDFDTIESKNGFVYRTWHGGDVAGKSQYKLENNTLNYQYGISFKWDSSTTDEDDCLVSSSSYHGGSQIIKHKPLCSIWTDSFDEYFNN